ncbi:hypothetical protein IJG14_01725 [bacterium]|nr:hypothetical protein [bacterium]
MNSDKYANTYKVEFVDEASLDILPANTLQLVANGLDIDSITRVDALPANPSEEKLYEYEGTLYYYDNDEWHTVGTAQELQAEIEARQAEDNNLQEQIDALEVASDVKDVVATKAELDDYDTSSLEDNAIIKVLTDETHDDQTAYYRYNEQLDSFIFIGAVSPYYTKSETNTLLDEKVDKVAGKGLSTNDYTDAEKTKLEGIEAGAEVNVQSDWSQADSEADDFIKNKPSIYTQSEVDSLLDDKQNTLTAGNNITISNDVISADVDSLSNNDWETLFPTA